MRISDCSSDVCSSDLCGEKYAVVEAKAKRCDQLCRAFLAVILGDGAARLAALDVDIAKPGMAFAARPVVHVVEELAAALARPGCRNGAHDAPALHDAGEQPEARSTEMIGDVDDLYRVAQVRLVIAVFQHRFPVRNARERCWRDRAARAELFEHAVQRSDEHTSELQ